MKCVFGTYPKIERIVMNIFSGREDNAKKDAAAAAAKSLQSCPTLCNPIDSSLPGSSVPGVLQARILEWVAISSSKKKNECSSK